MSTNSHSVMPALRLLMAIALVMAWFMPAAPACVSCPSADLAAPVETNCCQTQETAPACCCPAPLPCAPNSSAQVASCPCGSQDAPVDLAVPAGTPQPTAHPLVVLTATLTPAPPALRPLAYPVAFLRYASARPAYLVVCALLR